jgi:hypothetical protein
VQERLEVDKEMMTWLTNENRELCKILVASIQTARKNDVATRTSGEPAT